MSPRGGPRANQTGRPRRADDLSSASVRVPMTPTERALLRPAPDGILRPGETPAGFLRKYGMREAERRAKRLGK